MPEPVVNDLEDLERRISSRGSHKAAIVHVTRECLFDLIAEIRQLRAAVEEMKPGWMLTQLRAGNFGWICRGCGAKRETPPSQCACGYIP